MYTDIKKVRAVNGEQFIKDFKSSRECLVRTSDRISFRVKRKDVWDMAKEYQLDYRTDLCPYVVKRKCLTLI